MRIGFKGCYARGSGQLRESPKTGHGDETCLYIEPCSDMVSVLTVAAKATPQGWDVRLVGIGRHGLLEGLDCQPSSQGTQASTFSAQRYSQVRPRQYAPVPNWWSWAKTGVGKRGSSNAG